ncbi:MAG: HepT-like ribonuclease domain-containing protein, partial [Candidatus Saliniplasma sp.]
MDKKRINRYRQKISLITKRKSNISTWIKDTDEKSILAVYKAYQETVEAFTDIFAMILKDINEIVEDDYTNIEKLGEKGILDGKEEGLMKEANGLRNR